MKYILNILMLGVVIFTVFAFFGLYYLRSIEEEFQKIRRILEKNKEKDEK